jgi:cyclophilin family peptidyl-prolyl cis-trans isomerase
MQLLLHAVGTEKRERQKANRSARLEAEQKSLERQKLTQRLMLFGVIGAFVVGVLYLVSQTGSANEFDPAAVTPTTVDPTAETAVTEPQVELPTILAPEPGGAIEGATECPAVDGSSERTTSFAEAPPICIDQAKSYTAEIETTKGTFTIDLNAAGAPDTVNNFVVLARYHYYDDVPFHRIIPGFVVQGGDAVGGPNLGAGNPGYQFNDELPETAYEIGSVAMANSGPDTNGSQFFVVTGDSATTLPLAYSSFGFVSEGLDVALGIESVGTASGAPTEDVRIISVTITES